MLVRNKVIDRKEFSEGGTLVADQIRKASSNSELMIEKKRHLQDKTDSIITNTVSRNEQQLLSETADVIEILISNLRTLNISEEKLVSLMKQKNDAFGSFDEGFIK